MPLEGDTFGKKGNSLGAKRVFYLGGYVMTIIGVR